MSNITRKCNFTDIDELTRILRISLSIPTFIIGLLFNIPALYIFCHRWKKKTKTSVYMINLAISDVLLLFSLPFKVYYSSAGAPGLLCASLQFLYFINTYVSIYTIVGITVDRYICIKNPFKGRAHQSLKPAICYCIIIWVATAAFSSSMYVFHSNNHTKCFNMSDQAWNTPLIASVEILGFVFPLIVMVFCSAQNIQVLRNLTGETRRRSESSLRVIINLVVFLVCFTPVHLAIFLQCLVRQQVIKNCDRQRSISLFIQVSMIVANFNCCLDAIFYYFAGAEFRRSIKLSTVTAPHSTSNGMEQPVVEESQNHRLTE